MLKVVIFTVLEKTQKSGHFLGFLLTSEKSVFADSLAPIRGF